jgi:predicted ribosomally synthesized peptide with SipW-like signal peptide
VSRLGFIAAHPKRTLSVLATCMVAAGLTVGSGAYFSDASATKGNTIEAGTVDITTYGSPKSEIDFNNCRSATDDFVDPAGTAAPHCADGSTQTTTPSTPTITMTHLVPGTMHASRCFIVQNSNAGTAVPAALRAQFIKTGGSDALASAVRIVLTNAFNGSSGKAQSAGGYSGQSLTDLVAAGEIKADQTGNGTERDPLEPGEQNRLCVVAWLPESDVSQDELQGDSLSFNIKVVGRTLYSAAS